MADRGLYREITFGYDEPDIMWSNGRGILDMRRKIGINDINDSNGEPIIPGECYSITRGGITLPVAIDDDNDK